MSRLASNTFWILLAQIGGLVIPLIELPVLARALGQHSYGQVLYALGVALTASVFIEFGFNFSAARNVALAKGDRKLLAGIVADVMLAKVLLTLLVGAGLGLFLVFNPGKTPLPAGWYLWISLFTSAFGFTTLWYYIGTERLIFPALFDLGIRSAGLLMTILLIKHPSDAGKVLSLQASVGITNTLVPMLFMFSQTGLGPFRLKRALMAIRQSWELFLYKGAQSLTGSLATMLLGGLSGAMSVGAFVPAEKLTRAVNGIVAPVLNAAFPHLVHLHTESWYKSRKVVAYATGIIFVLSILFAALVTLLAPWIIQRVFGPNYPAAISVLRLLVWVVPLRISNMALAILWFIPGGQDRLASRVILFNIMLVLMLAVICVPLWRAAGMANAFLLAETVMFITLVWRFCKQQPTDITVAEGKSFE